MNLPVWAPAVSSKPETWPSSWPDHPEYGSNVWNGLLGPYSILNSLEAYFVVDDYWDTEMNDQYHFFPDYADTLFTGHGIVTYVRYIQPDDEKFDDVIFKVYDIKNISTHNYEKVVFGNITGSLSGGDGDSGDDLAEYDSSINTIISFDADGKGNTGQPVGVLSESIIQSPNESKITSFNFFNLAVAPDMRNDELLWNRMIPGDLDVVPPTPQDCDYLYGTGYFSLAPGEMKRIVSVIALGDSKSDVIQNIQLAKIIWNSEFNTDSINKSIEFSNLNYHRILTATENIKWTSTGNNGYVDLWFSSDLSATWKNVGMDIPNNGTYNFNTTILPDCPFGKFRIILKDTDKNAYDFNESDYFSVDNAGNGSPFIKITNTAIPDIMDGIVNLNYLAGDADNEDLQLTAYYSYDGGITYQPAYIFQVRSDTLEQSLLINLTSFTNTENAVVKLELTDGNTTAFDVTDAFLKINQREIVNSQYIQKLSGLSEVPVQINIIDKDKLTGNEYLVTFDDTSYVEQKYFSVFDLTKRSMVLNKAVFTSGLESSIFDGLSILSDDIITKVDSTRTRWNFGVSKNFTYKLESFSYQDFTSYNNPCDYIITYYDSNVDTSYDIHNYVSQLSHIPPKPINFNVNNVNTNKKIKVAYNLSGSITSNQNIFFIEDVLGKEKVTWKATIYYPAGNTIPKSGDTLYLFTRKGLSVYDTIKIKSIPVSVEGNDKELNYFLSQNYPNPFNPATIIKFSIPTVSEYSSTEGGTSLQKISLVVYDILGNEVATIVDEEKATGEYTLEFNSAGLSSGVYFYRLKAGSFIQTKKMILLR